MRVLALAGALLATSGLVWGDCQRPEAPAIPDGDRAEREIMVEAHGKVQAYIQDGNEYLDCLKRQELAELEAGDASEESLQQRTEEYNSAVDEMQEVGDQFNGALKAFNARQ